MYKPSLTNVLYPGWTSISERFFSHSVKLSQLCTKKTKLSHGVPAILSRYPTEVSRFILWVTSVPAPALEDSIIKIYKHEWSFFNEVTLATREYDPVL